MSDRVLLEDPAKRQRRAHGLVTIVVPAKNEEAAIGETLRGLPLAELHKAGFDTEVFLLDGNSQDDTCLIARRHGAVVLHDPVPGKGAAMRHARPRFRGDYVIMIDADGTYPTAAIPALVNRMAWGDADIVMGVRRPQPGAMKRSHRVGNVLLSLTASVLYGRRCRDLCTGMWGFRGAALRALPLRCRGFELEAELFSLAARLRLRIAEIPIDYLPRKGETKLSATRDGLRIVSCLLRSRFVSIGDRSSLQRRVPVQEPPMRIEVFE